MGDDRLINARLIEEGLTDERPIVADPWSSLRQFTAARIALGRAGHALPLHEVLALRLAHARARDAVHEPFDDVALGEQIRGRIREQINDQTRKDRDRVREVPVSAADAIPIHHLASCALDRLEYLQRPDKGRTLDPASIALLSARPPHEYDRDVALIVADGLSSIAVHAHAPAFVAPLLASFAATSITVGALCLVRQGRVAIGDEIGPHRRARLSLVILGERPGLTAPDSLGVYLTYAPRPGLTDESRNCISNIRPAGLPLPAAAERVTRLVLESLRLQLSGVTLKDMSASALP
jgi:ethanolamine ammonia-lyase small subunit